MTGVTHIHGSDQSTDTDDRKVISMNASQLSSSVRIDLERTPRDRRRAVLFELIDLPEHSPAFLDVGAIRFPEPGLVDPLVRALIEAKVNLRIEGVPSAVRIWHGVVSHHARARCDVWVER